MEPAIPSRAHPKLEVHGTRASSVITQHIPANERTVFLEWQQGISEAASKAAGYQTTEIYPPATPEQPWVVILHFDDPTTLKAWLDSPERAAWVARLPVEVRDFRLQTLSSGFGAWFAGTLGGPPVPLPPRWKMALTILFTLYPTVMLLSILVRPYLSTLGLSLSMLVSNILSITILQWLVQPALDPVLGPWLRANQPSQRRMSLAGLLVLLLLLASMALAFRLAVG